MLINSEWKMAINKSRGNPIRFPRDSIFKFPISYWSNFCHNIHFSFDWTILNDKTFSDWKNDNEIIYLPFQYQNQEYYLVVEFESPKIWADLNIKQRAQYVCQRYINEDTRLFVHSQSEYLDPTKVNFDPDYTIYVSI